MKNEIPFASAMGRPQDALDNVCDVLDMLSCFFSSVDDLTNFQCSEKHNPIGGLYTVIDACGKSIRIANDEICEQLHRSVDLEFVSGGIPESAFTTKHHRLAWRDGFDAGVKAYRDHGAGARPEAPGDEELLNDTVSHSNSASAADEKISLAENAIETGTEVTYPRLTARDHAIASAVKEGYDLPEVAKAVNLKKATVERIVAKLRDDGVLPRADAETETPKSASA